MKFWLLLGTFNTKFLHAPYKIWTQQICTIFLAKYSMQHVKFSMHISKYYVQSKFFYREISFISRIFYCAPIYVRIFDQKTKISEKNTELKCWRLRTSITYSSITYSRWLQAFARVCLIVSSYNCQLVQKSQIASTTLPRWSSENIHWEIILR